MLQVLGRGGFGIVFRAFDEVLQRVVALKVLAPTIAATSPARKRFLREARSSAQVRHENVVQVYAVEEQPLPYLVMEFIPGETLQQRLNRVGPLETPEIVRIGRQIAEGLAAAHAMDLIHRDIKPGNILLEGGHQRVKITDFGLARAADDASLTQSGVLAGTPMYMAPEQAQGEKIDHRADLFSLGSVLYVMAAGRPPFRASTTFAVLKRVVDDDPRPIREVIPETPQWLCDVIAKLHAKKPDDRFQSAREAADVLADCEAQLKANARLKDYSRIPRSKPQRFGRRKWVAAAAAMLLPVIALVVTESARVTHLFRGRQISDDPIRFESGPKIGPAKSPAGAMPGDAVLVMTFEKDTFFEKDGKTWVRDLSGRGNDGVCDGVSFTPDGKAGGGLACQGGALRIPNSLIHGQANYTITGWCRRDGTDPRGFLYMSANSERPEPLFWVGVPSERSFHVTAWNKDYDAPESGHWLDAATHVGVVPDQGWYFFAVTMRDGGVGRGTLRVTVNETTYALNTQMVKTLDGITVRDLIAQDMSGTVIDEIAVFQRRCRTMRSCALRELGQNNVPLSRADAVSPAAAAAPFTDADVQRIAALPAEQQVEEVRKELIRRNPGFDGKMETKIEGGVVTEIHVVTDEVTDISPLRVFNALRVLDCSGTHTADWRGNGQLADLNPLKGVNFSHLIDLNFSWTKLDDAGLAHFKDCKDLTGLKLRDTRVTDAGLAHFKDCRNLTYLDLHRTHVSNAGLAHFKGCKDLTYLSLPATGVSDAGLALFKECKSLTTLDLSDTPVSDAGLAAFKDCKNLKMVLLGWATEVTDAGLASLKDCKKLMTLDLRSTKVTDLSLLRGCRSKNSGATSSPTATPRFSAPSRRWRRSTASRPRSSGRASSRSDHRAPAAHLATGAPFAVLRRLRQQLCHHLARARRSAGSRGPGSGTSASCGPGPAGAGSSPASRGREPGPPRRRSPARRCRRG